MKPCPDASLLLRDSTRDSKTIIRVLKFWRYARARGAARDFCVMAPRAAAGASARSFRRALRVAIRGNAIVVGAEPVRAPFVHVCADVAETVGVAFRLTDPFGPSLPPVGVIAKCLRRLVTPRKLLLFGSAARGALPFGFSRETIAAIFCSAANLI